MKSTQQTYRQRLLKVLAYINEHLDEDLALERLARISHFSPFHFHRVFRAMVGEPVYQHVRRLRLELAAVRLKQTTKPVLELALDVGYESHESFTRAFKTMFGVSPSEFRNRQAHAPNVDSGLKLASSAVGVDMKVEILNLPTQRIAFIHHVGPYDDVGPAFEALMMWAGPRGLIGPGAKVLGVCYDDPSVTPSDKIRYDAAITVDGDVEPEGEVGIREIPGGPHAVVCHQGPYSELSTTYDFVYGRWLPASGHEPADAPPFEYYLNDPESTDPEELLTDLYVPLKE